MSTFYATFEQAAKAQQVLDLLLSRGVQPDDVSVLTHESADEFKAGLGLAPDDARTTAMTDASFYVGRTDDPPATAGLRGGLDPNPHEILRESPVNYGISSAQPDDSAESMDQMDDGQAASEDVFAPDDNRSYSSHEDDDLRMTLNSNFPTDVPVIDDFEPSEAPDVVDSAHALEGIPLADFGVVLGGGALATAALDLSPEARGNSGNLRKYLEDEGMTAEEADEFLNEFQRGKTLLAVALIPGEIEAPYVEELASNYGAGLALTRDAKRY